MIDNGDQYVDHDANDDDDGDVGDDADGDVGDDADGDVGDDDESDDGIALLVKEIYVLGKRQVVVPHNQP